MATINLGSIKFNWKGSYSGATAYVVDDVVESSGSSYICIAATTGNAPPNATYWEQMSSAGTNGTDGTDLGTTLTTQGDIVYRDASGLARLPAGSANQVLQSGGAGANPSWGTVSSDMVKVSSGTISSTVSEVDFKTTAQGGVFDFSTYNRFKVYLNNWRNNFGNVQVYLRVFDSNNILQTTSYAWALNAQNTTSAIDQANYADGQIQLTRDGIAVASHGGGTLILDVPNLSVSGTYKSYGCLGWVINGDSPAKFFSTVTGGAWFDTDTQTGFRLYLSSGDWINGTYEVYGIK